MLTKLFQGFNRLCLMALAPLANVAARIYIGLIFFRSGQAKLDDYEETVELFEDDWVLPFMPAEPAAFLATAGELILPVLLFVGLLARVGAAGLLVMAVVIQVWVLQDPQHYLWIVILALLVGYGGGPLSLDRWLFGREGHSSFTK